MKASRRVFWLGVRDLLPLVSGVLPFGLVAGATGISLGMSPEMVMGMTLLLFAGSAQLAVYSMVQDNVPLLIIVITSVFINLRFAIYSAAFASLLGPLKKRYRFPLAYMLSDQMYGLCSIPEQLRKPTQERLWYLAGVSIAMWVSWFVSVVFGVVLGASIPSHWSLEFTIPLAFLVMLMSTITNRQLFSVAVISSCAVILLQWLPYNLGFIVTLVISVLGGMFLPDLLKISRTSDD